MYIQKVFVFFWVLVNGHMHMQVNKWNLFSKCFILIDAIDDLF